MQVGGGWICAIFPVEFLFAHVLDDLRRLNVMHMCLICHRDGDWRRLWILASQVEIELWQ